MNKAQLVDELATRFGGSKPDARHALDSVIDVVQRSVSKGEAVTITGFGTFEKVARPARTARNPRTGESVKVKKTSVPRFRAGSAFKAITSGTRKLPKVAGTASSSAKATKATKAAATTKATKVTKATAATSPVSASKRTVKAKG